LVIPAVLVAWISRGQNPGYKSRRARSQGLCAICGVGHHRCRPPFQSRPARLLFRARLSRLVFRTIAADRDRGGNTRRHVAAAIRLRIASRRRFQL